jgi:hypothetical protein
MSATLDQAAIARNVRQWRHQKARRAVRVEVRRKQVMGEEPSLNEKELELRATRLEASEFRNPLLP